ncbi:MAG: hypothetical protein IJX61_04555, partial [Ruminococcus sp.]|nr:hypothetical protein [Ruminococcus sp.]
MEKLKSKLLLAAIIIAAISLTITVFLLKKPKDIPEQQPEIITQNRIEEIIDVSRLSTFEAIYNGVAK